MKHLLEYWMLTLFSWKARIFPEWGARLLARFLGWFAHSVVGIRKSVALANIRAAFPDAPQEDVDRICRESYGSLALLAVEFVRQGKYGAKGALERVELKGIDALLELDEKKQGAIVIAGHLGNWELTAGAIASAGVPMTAVVEHMKNRRSDRLVDELRRAVGLGIHYTDEPATRLVRILRGGGVLGILIDQDAGKSGVFVDFFGRKASMPKGAALLALRERVPVFICLSTRRPDGTCEGLIERIGLDYDSGVTDENILRASQLMTDRLAEEIRRYPGQWFWLHRRWKTRPPDERELKRALVLQTAFLGDVVLATPIPEALAGAGWEVDFLTIPCSAGVLDNNPHISKVIRFDKRGGDRGVLGIFRLARRLRAGGYEAAIVPHRSLRSALLLRLARIPRRIGFDKSAGSFLFTDVVRYSGDVHEVERNLSLLEPLGEPLGKPLGLKGATGFPRLYPSDDDRRRAGDLLKGEGFTDDYKLVAIAPGSIWHTKRWLPEYYKKLGEMLVRKEGVRVIMIGGSEDADLCESLCSDFAVSFAGKATPLESAALLERCEVLVSNDSAPMHLAVAMGTPVVAIFGPTVPEFGFYPYGKNDVVIGKELSCRPCAIHGGLKCPIGTFECMLSITPEEVFRKVKKKLAERVS